MLTITNFKNKLTLFKKIKIDDFVAYFSITLLSCLLIQYSIYFVIIGWISLISLTILNWKKRIVILSIVSILYISFILNWISISVSLDKDIENEIFKIYSIKSNYVIVGHNFQKYYIPIFSLNKDELILNRYLSITGKVTDLNSLKSANSYEFDFERYLKNSGISKMIRVDSIQYLNKGFLYKLNVFYTKLFDTNLSKLLVSNNRSNNKLFETLNTMSLSYLINFSGLPIFAMSFVLTKIMKAVKIRTKFINWILVIIDGFVLMFCFTINLPFIITKTFLFLLIKNIFLINKIKINKKKLWIICFSILISIHNEVFLSKTFYYYLVAFIFLKQPKTKRISIRIAYNLLICSLTFGIVNMMVDYRFYYFNEFIDMIIGPLFAIENVFVYLTFWIPKINIIYEFIEAKTILELNYIDKINLFYSCGYIPIYIYWLYFAFLYGSIRFIHTKGINYSLTIFLIGIIGIIFAWKEINTHNQFLLMDVGNGQTFIYHNNNETTIFDVGTGVGYSKEKLANYLKYLGINRINNIFISHYHTDHYDQLDSLNKNKIIIDKVIKRENSELYYRTNNLIIKVFKPLLNDKNENNNSLVYLIKWKQLNIFVMSDLENKGQEILLKNERFLFEIENCSIDYLIAGHHGSKTAFNEEMIGLLRPKVALISCHDNINRHFPDLITINILNSFNILYKTTQEFGDIKIRQ